MARRSLPPVPKVRMRFFRSGMDMKFIVRNWRSINETPIKKAGLLIRTIMRGSIRRAGISKKTGLVSSKPSPPGKPPRARFGVRQGAKSSGIPFKKIVSVPYEDGTKAVIGHVLLPIKKDDPRVTPMQAHEFGKRVRTKLRLSRRLLSIRLPGGRKARTKKQAQAARRLYLQGRITERPMLRLAISRKKVKMPKRPFAYPALKRARKKLGQFWRNMVNKGTVNAKPPV